MTVNCLVQSHIIRSRSSAFKEETSKKKKVSKFVAMALIFFIIVGIFFYILQVNTIAAKGYKIRGLKKKIDTLGNESKILQVNISNLKSINFLQSKTQALNMLKAQDVEYVNLPAIDVVVAE